MILQNKQSIEKWQQKYQIFLTPIAALYALIITLRNYLFDWKISHTERLPKPVVSIGNITAGGTGKTPFLLMILEMVGQMQFHAAILTRGYGRQHKIPIVLHVESSSGRASHEINKTGDEPYLIALKNPDIPIGIDAKRFQSGIRILDSFPTVDLFFLDDGFQHRKLHRDIDILIVDVTKPFLDEKVIPAGQLREPLSNLKRADCFVLSRYSVAPEKGELIKNYLTGRFPGKDIFIAEQKIDSIINLQNRENVNKDFFSKYRLGAFSGIGNPESFEILLKELPCSLVFHDIYPDHHHYTKNELQKLFLKNDELHCQGLITTEKDMVKLLKLKDSFDKTRPIFVLSMTMSISDEMKFQHWFAKQIDTINSAGKEL